MPENGTNLYAAARRAARLTQEQAAEALHLSPRCIKDYEGGARRPPAATVRDMARVYGAPWLCAAHARETDELGVVPEDTAARTLPQVTVQLVGYMLDWSERRRARQLLAISADSVIDAEERTVFDEIVCELEAIAAAWLALKAMAPPGAKKERPEVAPSKRSVLGKTENHRKNIIPACPTECKPYFCAGEEVSLP